MLAHVVQRDQNLDSEPFDETQRKALEVVHLDEVVEVDAEQFKSQAEMLSTNEMVKPFHNIFLIFWVVSIQSFN